MPPTEVFLSHSSHDRDMAESIAQVLQSHGIPTFYSPMNLIGAQQWQNEILKGLQRCDWFAVLLTPDAVDSMWVRRETAYALNDPRYENRIVPLQYRPCDLGSLEWLSLSQFVDVSGDFESGCRDLLRIWGMGFRGISGT
jgi:hypothetical protein